MTGPAPETRRILNGGAALLAFILGALVGVAWATWAARTVIVQAIAGHREALDREHQALTKLSEANELLQVADCAVRMVGLPSTDWWAHRRRTREILPLAPECDPERGR